MDWQPIETAPKRGQVICGHSVKKWVRFGRRFPGQNDWYYSGTNERTQYAETIGDEPTHWMMMPKPPKDA